MTTEIETKLREIEQDKFVSYAQRDRLVQALRRGLEGLNAVEQMPWHNSESPYAVKARKALTDIAKILSAPNDKEGE